LAELSFLEAKREWSCAAAAEFFGFKDDHIFVEGLQGGVGEAGGSVEDGAAEDDHVEPFDEGAGGEAIEDGLLVEATGVEVGVAKGGAERGVGEALLAVDEFGLHGGVEVVLGDPVGDSLGEGVVVEGVAEFGDGAVDLDDLVDGAGVFAALGADEADIEGGDLGVFEPGVEEEVAATEAEGGDFGWGSEGELLHFAGELGGGALVGVEEEDPRIFEGDGGEGGVAVGGVVVEGAGVEVGSGGLGDGGGGVGGLGVEDVDVVGPGDGVEGSGEVALFVPGEDEDRDHCGYGIAVVGLFGIAKC